jgi:methyltransferase (TIGR00027 family)
MRDDTPSRTAAWVAAARHLGRLLPERLRLADDPFGAAFTSPMLAQLIEQAIEDGPMPNEKGGLSLAGALRRVRHPLTKMPGLRSWILYMQVRTRVIDDALRGFLERHAARRPQLVKLGAGYDCRALRMPELDDARVFEIDHPATQGHKRSVLERHGIDSPSTYVTWDFEQRPVEDLPDALAEAGHDASEPTFTIWEGVTMYLTEPAIDASLRAIRSWSAPGSELAMTYFARSRLARPSIDSPRRSASLRDPARPGLSIATRVVQAVVSMVGEPWRWGWEPEELPGYLAERGLELIDDIGMNDAAQSLLPPELASSVVDPSRRVALAAAPESIAVVHAAGS